MRSKMKRIACMLLTITIMVCFLIAPAMASDCPGHVLAEPGYKSNAEQHWMLCKNCGEFLHENHFYTDDADASCNRCGYLRYENAEHECMLEDFYRSEDDVHWVECIAVGCPYTDNCQKAGYGSHEYDNDADANCNVCGRRRDVHVEHTMSTWYTYSDTHHWKVCIWTECPADPVALPGADYSEHVYDDDQDTHCNVCDRYREVEQAGPVIAEPNGGACDCELVWVYVISYTENHHCVYCATCGGGYEEEAHIYTSETATTCRLCGYDRSETPAEPEETPTDTESSTDTETPAVPEESADPEVPVIPEVPNESESDETNVIAYLNQYSKEFTGTFIGDAPQTVKTGETVTLVDATCAGYTFKGWYSDRNCTMPITTVTATADSGGIITVFALWEANPVVVNYFNEGGAAFTGELEGAFSPVFGSVNMLPSRAIRAGYYFGGWYSDPECTVQITYIYITDPAITSVDLYAKWKPVSYPINYYDEGPSGFTGTFTETRPTEINFGETIVLPTPVRDRYVFAGWFTDPQCTQNVTSGLTATNPNAINVNLYAKWETAPEYNYGIIIDGQEYGNVTVSGAQGLMLGAYPGDVIKITGTPNEGYQFELYSVIADSKASVTVTKQADGSYTFVMPAENVIVRTAFTKVKEEETEEPTVPDTPSVPTVTYYQVNVETSENGTVTSNKTNVTAGTTVTLSVSAEDGYLLETLAVTTVRGDAVTLSAAEQSGDSTIYTFAMPTGNVTVSAVFAKESPAVEYADVKEGSWYYEAVSAATEMGLLYGYGNGSFGPSDAVTRAMTVTVLARFAGVDTSTGATWYSAGAEWAVAQGVSDGTNLNNVVTREQIVAMIWRMMGKPSAEKSDVLNDFADCGETHSWATDAMKWAVEAGVVKGVGNNRLNPLGTLTRAELATLLVRLSGMTGQ